MGGRRLDVVVGLVSYDFARLGGDLTLHYLVISVGFSVFESSTHYTDGVMLGLANKLSHSSTTGENCRFPYLRCTFIIFSLNFV